MAQGTGPLFLAGALGDVPETRGRGPAQGRRFAGVVGGFSSSLPGSMLSRLVRSVALRGLVACALAFWAQGSAATERGAVVFGSWLTPHFAETARARVSAALGVECRIVQVRLDGQVFHRLLSPAAEETAARALLARAQNAGFGAWYLAEASAQVVADDCRCEDDAAQTAAAPSEAQPAPASAPAVRRPNLPTPSPRTRRQHPKKIPAGSSG